MTEPTMQLDRHTAIIRGSRGSPREIKSHGGR